MRMAARGPTVRLAAVVNCEGRGKAHQDTSEADLLVLRKYRRQERDPRAHYKGAQRSQ